MKNNHRDPRKRQLQRLYELIGESRRSYCQWLNHPTGWVLMHHLDVTGRARRLSRRLYGRLCLQVWNIIPSEHARYLDNQPVETGFASLSPFGRSLEPVSLIPLLNTDGDDFSECVFSGPEAVR